MSRVSMIPAKEWDDELRNLFSADTATPLEQGAVRIMAHRTPLAKALVTFGSSMWGNRTLPRRLIELIRLRVAFHNQCRSCMAVRYRSAIDDGLTEDMVCSLEKPVEATELTDRERAAISYADLSAADHLSIDDQTFADLRRHFTEPEIVELGMFIAFFIGFGRLGAAWDMVEELPASFQDKSAAAAPWSRQSIVVRG